MNESTTTNAGNPPTHTYDRLIRQSRKMGKLAAKWALSRAQVQPKVVLPEVPKADDPLYHQMYPDKMHRVVEQAREILMTATTVMLPSNLFPDTVTVDRMKVSVKLRTFFWTENVVSVRIEDILNVSTGLGPFFGSLRISTRVMNSIDHFEIRGFWRKEAIELKRIIQGYMIAVHEDIETSSLSTERLIRKLKELGDEPHVG